MILSENKSLVCYQPKPHAEQRLVCLPCAGGGASMYRSWADSFPDFEVWAVNYPGRETRHSEAFAADTASIVEPLVEASTWFQERPFALYGHSFGAAVAFMLGIGLSHRGVAPAGVCVSARRAPSLAAPAKVIDLPEDRFMDELERWGGVPDTIRNNPEMMDFYLPIIKADLTLNDETEVDSAQQLNCPLHLFSAVEDAAATHAELAAWRDHTRVEFSHKVFPGGHFFIQDSTSGFLPHLRTVLAGLFTDDDDLIAF